MLRRKGFNGFVLVLFFLLAASPALSASVEGIAERTVSLIARMKTPFMRPGKS
jgi:hypothetical protein